MVVYHRSFTLPIGSYKVLIKKAKMAWQDPLIVDLTARKVGP